MEPRENLLSKKEQDVIKLAAAGLSDKEIAARQNVTVGTTRTYWERIRAKLHATNRTHAACLAILDRHVTIPRPARE